MVETSHRQLHQFIDERAGDTYRAAFHYTESDWDVIYLREDLEGQRLKQIVPETIERLRERRALLRAEEYPPLGKTAATTEIHENGVLLHFQEGGQSGVIISLDEDAARDLMGFVQECLSRLQPFSAETQRSSSTPD